MQAEKTNIKPFWNKGSIEGLLSLVEKRCWTGVVTPCHLLPLLHAGRFMCKCTMGMVQARRYVSKQALWLTCKGSVWFGPSVLKLYPAGKHCFHYTMALPPIPSCATAQTQRACLGTAPASLNIPSVGIWVCEWSLLWEGEKEDRVPGVWHCKCSLSAPHIHCNTTT